MDEKSER